MRKNISSVIRDADLGQWLASKYEEVPTGYKKAFLLALVINLVVFLYIMLHFPAGNHDWGMFLWEGSSVEVDRGRWFFFIINAIFGFTRLPFISHFLFIIAQITAGLIAYRTLSKSSNTLKIVIFVLFVTLNPYICTYFYYSRQSSLYAMANLFAAACIYFAVKSNRSIKYFVLCAIFACLTPAAYQPQINALATLFLLHMIQRLMEIVEQQKFSLWIFIKEMLAKLAPIFLGFILYWVSLQILLYYNIAVKESQQFKTITVGLIGQKLADVCYHSFNILVSSQELFPLHLRIPLLALIIFAASVILYRIWQSEQVNKSKLVATMTAVALFIATVLLTKIIFIVSASTSYSSFRMQSGLIILYAFPVVILLSLKLNFVRSVIQLILAFCVVIFVHNDLAYQVMEVEQQRLTYNIAYDLTNRIRGLEGLDISKKYRYIQLGELPNFKAGLYGQRRFNLNPGYRAGDQIIRGGIQLRKKGRLLTHFMPELKISHTVAATEITTLSCHEKKAILKFIKEHKPWPAPGSVTIINGSIILVYADNSLNSRLNECDSNNAK